MSRRKALKKFVLLAALIIACIILFVPGYSKIQDLRGKIEDLETKNKRLAKENIYLQQELQRLDSDKFLQEKILREKMGVVRKDEIPIRVVPKDKKQ